MSLVCQFSILGKCLHFFRKMVDTIFKTLSWKTFDCYVHTCTKHTQSGLSCSKVDSTILRINLYPLDGAIRFPNTYPVDSDLSSDLSSAIQLLNNGGLITSVTCFTKFCHYNDQSLARNMNGT